MEKMLQLWKIVSVKEVCGEIRKNDPLKKVISNVNDSNLNYLKDFGRLAKCMSGKQDKRMKSPTKDIRIAIEHICCGLFDVGQYLIKTGLKFVDH